MTPCHVVRDAGSSGGLCVDALLAVLSGSEAEHHAPEERLQVGLAYFHHNLSSRSCGVHTGSVVQRGLPSAQRTASIGSRIPAHASCFGTSSERQQAAAQAARALLRACEAAAARAWSSALPVAFSGDTGRARLAAMLIVAVTEPNGGAAIGGPGEARRLVAR